VIDASTVWTRTAMERWAVMFGFSTGKLVGGDVGNGLHS
jgi:hypothetical protein